MCYWLANERTIHLVERSKHFAIYIHCWKRWWWEEEGRIKDLWVFDDEKVRATRIERKLENFNEKFCLAHHVRSDTLFILVVGWSSSLVKWSFKDIIHRRNVINWIKDLSSYVECCFSIERNESIANIEKWRTGASWF